MDYAFDLSSRRRVAEANYNTFVNPLLHPNRVLQQHDFLYILDGEWEIALEHEGQCEIFSVKKGDLMILPAQIHHYGTQLCSPNSRNMYIHVESVPGDHPGNRTGSTDSDTDFVVLPTVIPCGSHIEINRYFSEIIAVCWEDTAHKEKRLSCLFELLLCEMSGLESFHIPQIRQDHICPRRQIFFRLAALTEFMGKCFQGRHLL